MRVAAALAAKQLAAKGHSLVLVGRSPAKTAAVAREVGAPYLVADFADLAQVRELADKLQDLAPRVDVLANNAGGMQNIAAGALNLTNDDVAQIDAIAPNGGVGSRA